MSKVVERNKTYRRIVHLLLWVWVFFILPGNLTFDLFSRGPDRRHWCWLIVVLLVCTWRGIIHGRLPGVELRPYITHYGAEQPNLLYRQVCYTVAWIDLLVPIALSFIGLFIAAASGQPRLDRIYTWLYYPLALAIVLATFLELTPRTRPSTRNDAAERAWFCVALWTVVPAHLINWVIWPSIPKWGLSGPLPSSVRLAIFLIVLITFFLLGYWEGLPGTPRYYPAGKMMSCAKGKETRPALETQASNFSKREQKTNT